MRLRAAEQSSYYFDVLIRCGRFLMYIVYVYLDVLISHAGRLITGSSGHSVKMWSVVGVEDMRLPGRNNTLASQGLTMDDEMNLDGVIVSAAFDDTMDLVGKSIACQHFEQKSFIMSIRIFVTYEHNGSCVYVNIRLFGT